MDDRRKLQADSPDLMLCDARPEWSCNTRRYSNSNSSHGSYFDRLFESSHSCEIVLSVQTIRSQKDQDPLDSIDIHDCRHSFRIDVCRFIVKEMTERENYSNGIIQSFSEGLQKLANI